MSLLTPELARVIHEDRRRRLLAEREADQLRRAGKASRRSDRRERRHRGAIATLLRRGRVTDAKIARIRNSWLDTDAASAARLAATADEVHVCAGTSLEPGPHAYIVLDGRSAPLVVAGRSGPVTLTSDATLLVLTVAALRELSTSLPVLAAAWRHASEASAPTMREPEPEPACEFDVDAA